MTQIEAALDKAVASIEEEKAAAGLSKRIVTLAGLVQGEPIDVVSTTPDMFVSYKEQFSKSTRRLRTKKAGHR